MSFDAFRGGRNGPIPRAAQHEFIKMAIVYRSLTDTVVVLPRIHISILERHAKSKEKKKNLNHRLFYMVQSDIFKSTLFVIFRSLLIYKFILCTEKKTTVHYVPII